MKETTPHLTFDATIVGVKIVSLKEGTYYGQSSKGGVELTLRLDAPQMPQKPDRSRYHYHPDRRPDIPEKANDGESAADFKKRVKAAKDLAERYDHDEQRFLMDCEKYERDIVKSRSKALGYAQIVGFAAIIGSKPVNVRLTPQDVGLLPGFGVELLDAREGE